MTQISPELPYLLSLSRLKLRNCYIAKNIDVFHKQEFTLINILIKTLIIVLLCSFNISDIM